MATTRGRGQGMPPPLHCLPKADRADRRGGEEAVGGRGFITKWVGSKSNAILLVIPIGLILFFSDSLFVSFRQTVTGVVITNGTIGTMKDSGWVQEIGVGSENIAIETTRDTPNVAKKPTAIDTTAINTPNNTSTEVFLWSPANVTAVHSHLFVDGINRSSSLKMINNASRFLPNDQTVWIGILGNQNDIRVECRHFFQTIKLALRERERQGVSEYGWHVYIVYFWDKPVEYSCPGIEHALKVTGGERTDNDDGDNTNVVLHYAQRSIVEGRHWNETIDWVDTGKILPSFEATTTTAKTPVAIGAINTGNGSETILHHHLNYPVRTDILKAMSEQIKIFCEGKGSAPSLSDRIETSCDRSLDVTHFWTLDKAYKWQKEKLRATVSRVLADGYCATNVADSNEGATSNTTSNATKMAGPSCFIGFSGKNGVKGRKNANTEYVDTMLQSKIVVVSQRKKWEAQWRLMEALVSGAMVMTDKMLSLPPGFRDGVSIVEYGSSEELLRKVAYYTDPKHASERLSVAREGRRLAMEEYRSWHQVEKLVLGRIVTASGFHV